MAQPEGSRGEGSGEQVGSLGGCPEGQPKGVWRCLRVLGAIGLLGVLAAGASLWWIDSPQPSPSTVRAWERNYRAEVSNEVADFQGHWLSTDIGAYIYSYHHTAETGALHQDQLIERLRDFTIHLRSPGLLVLRRPVTYSRPDGYDEWRFQFDAASNLVTVLFANLDSEVASAGWLIEKARDYHERRRRAERAAAAPETGLSRPRWSDARSSIG